MKTDGALWTKAFWKDTAERVIRTFAAALAPMLIGGQLVGFDWVTALSLAGATALATLLLAVGTPAKTAPTPEPTQEIPDYEPRRALLVEETPQEATGGDLSHPDSKTSYG